MINNRYHKACLASDALNIYCKVSNSGLTQLGVPLFVLRSGPYLCKSANVGNAPQMTMIPCAAKHQVQPESVCQGAMKN